MSYKEKKLTGIPIPDELEDVKEPEQLSSPKPTEDEFKLPTDVIYKRMKKMTSFKKIKRAYKLEHQKRQFLNDLNELFKHLKVKDHQYDVELLVELCNAVEQYFIYGTREERKQSKMEVIHEVMLKFFNNDPEVLHKFLRTIDGKIKKSNVFRRIYRRIHNFFF